MNDNSEHRDKAVKILDNNLQIIACAGSGKTSFVAGRVAYLLSTGYVPENIIAFTYTERAAAELNSRIVEELKKDNILDSIKGFANMYIGTIHGWCLKALIDNEVSYQKFSVLDEIKLRLFVDKNYKSIGMKDIFKLDNPSANMKIFTDTNRFIQLMNVIRESDLIGELPQNIQEVKGKYENALKSASYFDFAMIMEVCFKKISDPQSSLSSYLEKKLKFLIVDEYQDVNPLQEKLIRQLHKLTNCNITVVGDDDQNIFPWRGSNNKFLQQFNKTYPNVHSLSLETNYRSSKGITGVASQFISKNNQRIPKNMISAEKQEFVKNEDVTINYFSTEEIEIEEIVSKIRSLRGVEFTHNSITRGLDYSDFSILLRTWKKSEKIVEIFERENIPYVTAGVNQLFSTIEIKAAVAIFRFINDEINQNDVVELWSSLPNNNIDKSLLQKSVENLNGWKPEKFQSHRKSVSWGDYRLQEVFWEFLKEASIVEETFVVEGNEESQTQAEIIFYNFGKFSQVINDFESVYLNSAPPKFYLFTFLNFIKYAATDYYPEGWINNPFKTPNAVQILTIHQSKGLEFPVVFIPGLNKNYLPLKKSGGLKVWHFLDSSLVKDQERYEPSDIDRIEDERRLLYVALTRSHKYLFISQAPENKKLYKERSQFVSELVSDYISKPLTPIRFTNRNRIEPTPKANTQTIALNFSILKDFFDCDYRFKLVTMYGFCAPLNQRMGLGKSLHDTLMAIHKRLSGGEKVSYDQIETLARTQSHFPYIGGSTELQQMKDKVVEKARNYYQKNENELKNIEFVEQDIKLNIGDDIFVSGRIDLIKRKNVNNEEETTIVEFKSSDDVQSESITYDQLSLYALGYQELTGKNADYVQIYDVENNKPDHKTPVTEEYLKRTIDKISFVANQIRDQSFPKVNAEHICRHCYQNRLCKARILLNLPSKK